MKHQHVDRIKSKFHLLNSQGSSEQIIWSCSDSSDYENNSYSEINVKPVKRKRKMKSKKNVSKNLSNLDITFTDGTEKNKEKSIEKSPDYNIRCFSNLSNVSCSSPILTSSQKYFAPFQNNKSPVIILGSKENKPASPVLTLKASSSKYSPKVRKKLFECNKSVNIETRGRESRSVSPVFTCTEKVFHNIDNITKKEDRYKNNVDRKREDIQELNSIVSKESNYKMNKNTNYNEIQEAQCSKYQEYNNNKDILDNTLTIKNVALIEKVKSYFDSHFSSTTSSQHSISEYESKSSPKSNDDNDNIEISNSLSDVKTSQTIKLENKSSSDTLKSFDDIYIHKTKKVKYKKDGLAYRLSALLKKQNANTSLWFHERFLAANSNFVLPKEEFIAFRIDTVNFKYGCYLLNVLDVNNEMCLIFINNLYVKNNTIEKDAIFKLYKPYKMLEFDGYKLIINVCKYECIILKKQSTNL